MRVTACCVWVGVLGLLQWAQATSDFCARPANMDLCWWRNNLYKRYLRLGRGDPFLRFGRSSSSHALGLGSSSWGLSSPLAQLVKRDASSDDLESYLENGGYLRFGRSAGPAPSSPILALLASDQTSEGEGRRKKRDVSDAVDDDGEHAMVTSSEAHNRVVREVKDGGFLRFGRKGSEVPEAASSASSSGSPQAGGGVPMVKKSSSSSPMAVSLGGDPYLSFGHGHLDGLTGFSKRGYLRFGRTSPEGYLRFGKRSQ